MMPTTSIAADILDRWDAFTRALTPDLIDLIGTEDAVSGLIDRSLLQQRLEAGDHLEAHDQDRLRRVDRVYRGAARNLVDRADVATHIDGAPIEHWWWHLTQVAPAAPPRAR